MPVDRVTTAFAGANESRLDASLTTQHSLTLNNMIPGTTYYLEMGSRNGAGTETAAPAPFITSTGKHSRSSSKN